MIVLATDFGGDGPYVGQLHAALLGHGATLPIVDLCHDLAPFRPRPAAYLLAAWRNAFPAGSIVVAVVDPGVGGARPALIVRADEQWLVGPDNGLLALAARRARHARAWRIVWTPPAMSASFHGRDLFAPVAARLSQRRADDPPATLAAPIAPASLVGTDWPDDLAEIAYIDRYGNATTGMRAARLAPGAVLEIAGHRLRRARTFVAAPPATPFWYENANGLAELAIADASVTARLGLSIGMTVGGVGPAAPAA